MVFDNGYKFCYPLYFKYGLKQKVEAKAHPPRNNQSPPPPPPTTTATKIPKLMLCPRTRSRENDSGADFGSGPHSLQHRM